MSDHNAFESASSRHSDYRSHVRRFPLAFGYALGSPLRPSPTDATSKWWTESPHKEQEPEGTP